MTTDPNVQAGDVHVVPASLAACVQRNAEDLADRIAVVAGPLRYSWRSFAHRIASLARQLRERGFSPGERIALLAGVNLANVEFSIAASWAGLVAVPLNTRLALAEMVDALKLADVAGIVFDVTEADRAAEIGEQLPGAQFCPMNDFGDSPDGLPPHAWDEDDIALILFTGGTTGRSKGVTHTAGALMIHGRSVRECLRYDAGTVSLHSQPTFHIAGVSQLTAVALAGACLVISQNTGARAVFDGIRQDGVNSIGAVPTTLAMYLSAPERDDGLLKRLRSVVYGAAPISPALLERVLTAMPNAGLCQFYGMTETGAVSALLPEDHRLDAGERLKSAGRPHAHVSIRITDTDGQDLGTNRIGEIEIRGSGITKGYWNDPERTAELFRNGWLRTGDAGLIDADGYLTIVDRFKDMIVTGGENVFSSEVENAISSHPAVQTCAVVGLPDELWGERVTAVVIPCEGVSVDEGELIAFCRSRIAGYKCPKRVIVRSTPLPVSDLGKVLKHVLRSELAAASLSDDRI